MDNYEGVEDTLFIPLTARINISKRFPEYFYDKKALEMEYLIKNSSIEKKSSEYTLMGWIVLMPHCYYENDSRPDLKDLLVDIHRDMIKMSDAVLIVNKNGYIGKSTEEEIKFAKALYKEIKYYETPVDMTTIENNLEEE